MVEASDSQLCSDCPEIGTMCVTISVVIPACNAQEHLGRCLDALQRSDFPPLETIVVDDGSKDSTPEIAAGFGVTVLRTGQRMGPSYARNRAAEAATGDILFFLDSDVCVRPDTLSKIAHNFNGDAELTALIGSYDSTPACEDFISQYRNLMHAYVHQNGAELASTFWSGCGAIRRTIFLEQSGFNEGYGRPAVEDIELGYRLIETGHKIVLDRTIEVTHLKRWTFWNLIKTDIMDRGIPWTELILRDRTMPNDLNLQLGQRVSVALVFILVALSAMLAVLGGAYLLIPPFVVLFLMLGRWWGGEASNSARPRSAFIILNCMAVLIALLGYWQKMYGLIPLVLASPALLALRHRYSNKESVRTAKRWLGILYICGLGAVAVHYLPARHLILACFAVLVLIGVLNSQFYMFLAAYRGLTFTLAAIPFHLLYHFYNGLSFMIGLVRHAFRADARGLNQRNRPREKERTL
jgi:cellulose synthase/poly-beta-1,6-N-acetylglucosamine synthase-like glycosyltransferase